ncbi:MAG TPA: hypothetical protein VKG78_00290 [Opitutaceae bacterium]|nr:hypothetical protein [Opitutaceae bacterium]
MILLRQWRDSDFEPYFDMNTHCGVLKNAVEDHGQPGAQQEGEREQAEQARQEPEVL